MNNHRKLWFRTLGIERQLHHLRLGFYMITGPEILVFPLSADVWHDLWRFQSQPCRASVSTWIPVTRRAVLASRRVNFSPWEAQRRSPKKPRRWRRRNWRQGLLWGTSDILQGLVFTNPNSDLWNTSPEPTAVGSVGDELSPLLGDVPLGHRFTTPCFGGGIREDPRFCSPSDTVWWLPPWAPEYWWVYYVYICLYYNAQFLGQWHIAG